MKARIPLTKAQKKIARQEISAILDREEQNRTRRMYKLICYALNRKFGFGASRICQMISEVDRLIKESESDEIFWEHLDRVVIDEIGLKFDRENAE